MFGLIVLSLMLSNPGQRSVHKSRIINYLVLLRL